MSGHCASPSPPASGEEPPAGTQGGYLPLLQAANPELQTSPMTFLFHPGMLFGSRERWWGNPAPRPTLHEGLDLWLWEDVAGRAHPLPADFRVPAPLSGGVARLLPDFLGQTVCLRHELRRGDTRLYSLLGHLRPRTGLKAGTRVAAGEVLGTLAAPSRPTRVPAHLHLTLAWLPPAREAELLDWGVLGRHPAVHLVDPLPWLRLPHRLTWELPLTLGRRGRP